MKIKICPNGDVEMLYTDALPLREVGEVEVRRASEVEYDHGRGGWTVRFTSGGWLGEGGALVPEESASRVFSARKDALAAEVRFLEAGM